MNYPKILSAGFALAAAALAALTVTLSLGNLRADPILVQVPQAAQECAQSVMDSLCTGDYSQAESQLYGTPSLGLDRAPADEVGRMIWKAYTDSLEYTFDGEFYATDTGIGRNVVVTALDLTSVTSTLKQRSQALLEHRVAIAQDVSQIYDENNEYREDFVMNVLFDAAYQSLQEDAQVKSQAVALNLVYKQGKWWVVPDAALFAAISGGTAGK